MQRELCRLLIPVLGGYPYDGVERVIEEVRIDLGLERLDLRPSLLLLLPFALLLLLLELLDLLIEGRDEIADFIYDLVIAVRKRSDFVLTIVSEVLLLPVA